MTASFAVESGILPDRGAGLLDSPYHPPKRYTIDSDVVSTVSDKSTAASILSFEPLKNRPTPPDVWTTFFPPEN